jgi:type III restriction enzyme
VRASANTKMELKDYQQTVINDLESFLEYVEKYEFVGKAFQTYWTDKGVKADFFSYKHNVKGTPHVCIKVPTAGGKTFIAVHALRPIFEKFPQSQAKVVVWLVPSITILDQTIKNLGNADHFYNRKLKTHFNGRVEVFTKQDVLQGVGFNSDSVREQLNIIVLSFDSLRARKKEDRKLYQENGYLQGFEIDESDVSVMSVLRSLKPVVIVDESHNAETDLSIEMLENLSPSFILDLTATPRNNSNIISYVDAKQLKKNNMVKLPVVVQNQRDKTEVIQNAIHFQAQLEEGAKLEEKNGGSYIRPIVLFQAEPKNAEDAVTFLEIKAKLMKLGIPEEQIKIKTAINNELKGVDLVHKDCPVRFIITINALKEGWDCPFAYILASLANKASAVDVEQILGRILRQPSVKQHQNQLLNLSYVFTASTMFQKTLENIVKGLNQAGFSNKDFRVVEHVEEEITITIKQQKLSLFPENEPVAETQSEIDDEIDISKINLSEPKKLTEFTEKALQINADFEKVIETTDLFSLPSELAEKTNMQPIKEIFAEQAKRLKLPQFFIKVQSKQGGFFEEDFQLFDSNELLTDFRLSQADTNIDFESLDSETYFIDLEEISKDDYKPTYKKANQKQSSILNEQILSLPTKSQIEAINLRFCKFIGNMYPIADKEVKHYVNRILEQLPLENMRDCLERDFVYATKIKRKISELSTIHKEKHFKNSLDTDKIIIQPNYNLPRIITPSSSQNSVGISKSLYVNESSMNTFEARVISEIANLENVVFWHKIIERKGFYLNGFINHYPDFLILTKNGRVVLLESKGDYLDNSDTDRKINLGKLWASKSGNNYRYFMVFDNNISVENSQKLEEAIKLISEL